LCFRLINEFNDIYDCFEYGSQGYMQDGIDLLAHRNESIYECTTYQCKKVNSFYPSDLRKAVEEFLKGKWKDKAKEFIICTSHTFNTIKLRDEVEDQKKILKDIGIDFQVWDKDELSRLLKDYPKLVYDFFGDIILDAFLGKELTQIFYQKFSEYAVLTIT